MRSTDAVHAAGADADASVRALGVAPRGAAVATSSGDLAAAGITEILHAATGSASRTGPGFDPTLTSVATAVSNALTLAAARGHARCALPFIGGAIFLDRIGTTPDELARTIVDAALASRGTLEVVLVAYGEEDGALFREVVAERAGGASPVDVVVGDIVDAALHRASAIVNAANMEVRFGGGVSGVIGRATGDPARIDEEAAHAVAEFWRAAED